MPCDDVGLGNLGHVNRAHDTGWLTRTLEAVLESEGVDHRGEHSHVVSLRAVHARSGAGKPTPDVATADNHTDTHIKGIAYSDDVVGDALHRVAIDSI